MQSGEDGLVYYQTLKTGCEVLNTVTVSVVRCEWKQRPSETHMKTPKHRS